MMDAASGLTYMQQRYYDPGIGRFLSVDPVTAYSNPVGAFNRYWYANNNPYKFIDPDGRANRNLFGSDDPLHAAGENFEMPGYYTIVGHAWQGSVAIDESVEGHRWGRDPANLVSTSVGLKRGQNIFLGQCGVGITGYAQGVADANNSTVIAAMGFVMYPTTESNDARPSYRSGNPVTLTVNSKADGSGTPGVFMIFTPGGEGGGTAYSSITYNPKTNQLTMRQATPDTGSRIRKTETIDLDKRK